MLERKDPNTKTSYTRGENFLIPITTLKRYKEITIAGDIMFINRIRFINTI